MKKYFLFFILFATIAINAFAVKIKKKNAEVGLFAGGAYYLGDLNPNGHFKFMKPAVGVIYRYNFNPRLALRGNFMYGSIEAYDSYSVSAYQRQRNLNFKTDIFELSAQFEFNFFDYRMSNEKEKFSPYIFLGLGVFKFDPKGLLKNNWVSLQPSGTEGQGLDGGPKRYKLIQVSIPFGVGIKTNVANRMGLSIEWGLRKTFTDYLDDVSTRYYDPGKLSSTRGEQASQLGDPSLGTDPNFSNVGRQRGDPTNKDWYAFVGMILTIKTKEKAPKCPTPL
jgi:Domain of unknown function (DUF6089)